MSLVYNPEAHDVEIVMAQFHRLMNELMKGNFSRNTYQPWEIQILLDIQAVDWKDTSHKDLLKRYQKAVQRAYERGAKMPMLLSEYLEGLKARRTPGRIDSIELPMAANQ